MKISFPSRLLALALTMSGGSALAAAAETASAPRPNIVFILSDDQGWGDVGYHGSDIKTPNIDRLAAAGVRLEQFYAQPLCSPSRAALLTGRYPMRYGLHIGVVRPHARYGLPLEERTLAQALKDAGYETALTGKWHLGLFQRAYLPTQRGFEHQYGLYNGNFDYFTHRRDGGLDWHRDDHALEEPGYATHLIAREAVRLIERRDPQRPLFLYVPFNAVHYPLQAPENYTTPYAALAPKRRTYAGMVAAMDEAIGQIIDAIARQRMTSNTLVVFCSDNGGPNPGVVASNGPFRGEKGTLYEGGVRVPALAVWPGQIAAGSVANAPLHMVDWWPTLAHLAGVRTDASNRLDGRDAWDVIAHGATSPHEEILLNVSLTGGAIRVGDWKLVVNGQIRDGEEGGNPRPGRAAEVASARATPKIELFNLRDDPAEKKNLAEAQPEKVADLRARLDRYIRAAVPSLQAPAAPDFKVPAVWGEP